jgi:hypothetical protein
MMNNNCNGFFSGTGLHLVLSDLLLLRTNKDKYLCQEVRSTRRSRVCINVIDLLGLHLVIQTYIYILYLLILLNVDQPQHSKEMK